MIMNLKKTKQNKTKQKKKYEVKHRNLILYRAFQTRQKFSNSNYFLPFDSASVDRLLDGVKRAAEVTAKDCLRVVLVTDPPSVRDDVVPTVGTKWQSHVQMEFLIR